MLKPVTADTRTEFLENSHQPLMRDAFLISVENIVTNIELGELERFIAVGDYASAYEALHIDDIAFRPYDLSFTNAYEQSATMEAMAMPLLQDTRGQKMVFRFDIRNIETSRWLETYLAGFITSITEEQRVVVRDYIQQSVDNRVSNRSIALGIAGRINPETQIREGGIVGLSKPMQDYVVRARQELQSGSLEDINNYLSRSLRDRRFDSVVKNTMLRGEKLDIATVDRFVQSYANRLLRYRASIISQVEAGVAINQGRLDSYNQAIRRGAFKSDQVEKTWKSRGDKNVRFTHKTLDRQSIPLYSGFKSSSGAVLQYPKDPLAPPEERIGCRCRMFIRVNGATR